MESFRELVRAALSQLGVRRMVVAIHDASFPALPDEDLGRGAPFSRGGQALLTLLSALGFDAVQLGPQGEMSRDNPSPYDTTIMSRTPLSLSLSGYVAAGWLDAATFDALVQRRPEGDAMRVAHRHAFDAQRRALTEIYRRHRQRLAAGDAEARDVAARVAAFRAGERSWLEPYALYAVLCREHGTDWFHDWPSPLDRQLYAPEPAQRAAAEARRRALLERHAGAIDAYAFEQLLAHEQHAELRRFARDRGLSLYADCQIGMGGPDMWHNEALFLRRYALGAPPSRTNPEGQPWGYAVLDPAGDPLRFIRERMGKLFRELDAVRLDHPHGLVCPWVYRTDAPDLLRSVQHGARLFSSPDLPDHPDLARYAIVRPEQLDRSQPRHADGWVRALSPAQIDRYAVLIDAIVACARDNGRTTRDLLCEVLSTCPHPLARVMERHGLGRFRVTQKANLDDPSDGYRSDNARPEDWIMVGTHDTRTLWSLVDSWPDDERARQARFLAGVLQLDPAELSDPRQLAHAKFAELFSCAAENVMIFFADLFGYRQRYNRPGTVDDHNWRLRVPPDFHDRYQRDAEALRALDLRRALALALRARASEQSRALASRLESQRLPC